MKKTIALFLIASLGFIGACKKTEPEPEPEVTPTEQPSNGTLTVILKKNIGSPTTPDVILATAFFLDNPASTNYTKVDCVIVNNVGLTYAPATKLYQTPNNTLTDTTKAKWEVKGNNGIPSFTYENKRKMPEYRDYVLTPDSIPSDKNGYTLTLKGLLNADSYSVTLTDKYGVTVRKTQMDVKINTVQFSPSDLSKLDASETIQVTLINKHSESTGGKRFSIQNEINYYKKIKIS